MRRQDSDIIRALPLFRDMSDAQFEELVRGAFLQRFPAHVVLLKEGELPDFLHVVVDGDHQQVGLTGKMLGGGVFELCGGRKMDEAVGQIDGRAVENTFRLGLRPNLFRDDLVNQRQFQNSGG